MTTSKSKPTDNRWHTHIIDEIVRKLSFLRSCNQIDVHKGTVHGSDVSITRDGRCINIEVVQDPSGNGWPGTIGRWSARHDLATFVVFTQPFHERVLETLDEHPDKHPHYEFFKRPNVFLMSDVQLPELAALIGSLVMCQLKPEFVGR